MKILDVCCHVLAPAVFTDQSAAWLPPLYLQCNGGFIAKTLLELRATPRDTGSGILTSPHAFLPPQRYNNTPIK